MGMGVDHIFCHPAHIFFFSNDRGSTKRYSLWFTCGQRKMSHSVAHARHSSNEHVGWFWFWRLIVRRSSPNGRTELVVTDGVRHRDGRVLNLIFVQSLRVILDHLLVVGSIISRQNKWTMMNIEVEHVSKPWDILINWGNYYKSYSCQISNCKKKYCRKK